MTNPLPAATEVNLFHTRSDKDSSKIAQHHTLGIDANQASPGDHSHDGRNSKLIGKGLNTGFPDTASGTYDSGQMQEVLNALRDLGFGS